MREPPVKAVPEAGSRNGVRRERRGAGPERAGAAAAPGISPPDWARGAVVYCVYPRAFSAEGTLEAVRARLGEIRALGAGALWILPIHPIGERGRKGRLGSPYAIRDYFAIDPAVGTPADFQRLVRDAHDLGLRVIIDLVLNHAALDHPDLNHSAFHRDGLGRRTRRVRGWSDVADWNFASDRTRKHLLRAVEHWVGEFDIDGYRCDVAGMVPADFWIEAHERLVRLKPDHLMIAEWDDPAMHRTAFHATYDWELYRAMVRASRARFPAAALPGIVSRRHSDFPPGAQPLRFVENHDEPRAVRRFRSAARGVTTFTALSGGLFLVYAGQEIGASHRPDLFDRDPIDWNVPAAAESRHWMQDLLRFRSDVAAFGPASPIPAGSSPWLAAYLRPAADGDRRLVVALNLSGRYLPIEGDLREETAGLEIHEFPAAGAPAAASAASPSSGALSRPGEVPPRAAIMWIR